DADYALRLVHQLQSVSNKDRRVELFKFLRANEGLSRTLTFLIIPNQDPAKVYALLDRLREKRADQLDKFASLTAAICVVHDRPLKRRINESEVHSPDPLAIFDFFSQNEPRLFFGVRNVPAELLIYVVDTTAQIDEMNWALQNYAKDPKVGGRFFDIRYDYEHYRRGTPKRVTLEGFNLPNIARYGGVCADQAYFAAAVGKSIGVPTAYTHGSAANSGHAWVGFLEATNREGWWNFDIGRYEAYRNVRGLVLDPQLHEEIPDSFVSLLAEMIGSKLPDRHNTIALTDAAGRLMEVEKSSFDAAPPAISSGILLKPRKADLTSELELLELAVKQNPADRWSWLHIRELAKSGRLSLDQKKKWADAIQRLCGGKYPDFALAILTPMIQTVDDVNEQNKLWNSAFEMFKNRSDLAAYIRMYQAAMWEKKGDVNNAGRCYEDVIQRYANAGPFVIDALQKAERALRNSNRANLVPVLYEQTWTKITKPKEVTSPYVTQSNWFRVGVLLATKLEEAGQLAKADAVRDMIGNPPAEAQRRR
ncbi:MAG TPA: hypothetical protein VGP94_03240, partial [Tepidisphaeraceae bacterium]|nr:hypothetical protein [Tepidisphaeraceae bacterium]